MKYSVILLLENIFKKAKKHSRKYSLLKIWLYVFNLSKFNRNSPIYILSSIIFPILGTR